MRLLHSVSIVETICVKHNIPQVSITTTCYVLEATDNLMDINIQLFFKSNHYNIIYDVDFNLQASPLHWYWRHVKVHWENQQAPLDR